MATIVDQARELANELGRAAKATKGIRATAEPSSRPTLASAKPTDLTPILRAISGLKSSMSRGGSDSIAIRRMGL